MISPIILLFDKVIIRWSVLQNRNSKITIQSLLLFYMNSSQLQEFLFLLPLQSESSTIQQLSAPLSQVLSVSLGENHLIVQTDIALYGYGSNNKGQLGNQNVQKTEQNKFIKIPSMHFNPVVHQVSCGWNHTLFLDKMGSVFSCGEGKNGAIGYGRGLDSYQIKKVGGLKEIKFISAGKDHSLALSGIKVYGWGNCLSGQLGIPKEKIYFQPQQLFVYPSRYCLASNKYSIFVTQKGVFATGLNEYGQLGLGNKQKVKMPKKINQLKENITKVYGSSKYCFFQSQDGATFLSGSGPFGQYMFPTKVKYFSNNSQVYLGQSGGLVRMENKQIYRWNEEEDKSPQSDERFNELSVKNIYVGPKIAAVVGRRIQGLKKKWLQMENKRIDKRARIDDPLMVQSWIEENTDHQIKGNEIFFPNLAEYRLRNQSQLGFKYQQILKRGINNKNKNQENLIGVNDQNSFTNSNYSPKNQENQKKFEVDLSHGSPYFRREKHGESSIYKYNIGNSRGSSQQQKEGEYLLPACMDFVRESNYESKNLEMIRAQYQIKRSTQQSQNELKLRIYELQKDNNKKDQQLLRMRKQLIQLIEIVQSDECLRNILEQKRRLSLVSFSKEVKQKAEQKKDLFQNNIEQLRQVLAKASNYNFSI